MLSNSESNQRRSQRPAVPAAVLVLLLGVAAAQEGDVGSRPLELLRRNHLPIPRSLPTCACSVPMAPSSAEYGITGQLTIGQVDGGISTFVYNPGRRAITAVSAQMEPYGEIDDVCGMPDPYSTRLGWGSLIVASQGATLAAYDAQTMTEVARFDLAEPAGQYALASSVASRVAYAYDLHSLWAVRASRESRKQVRLEGERLLGDEESGIVVAAMDSAALALTDTSVWELRGSKILRECATRDTMVAPSSVDAVCATSRLVVLGHNDRGTGHATLLVRSRDSWEKRSQRVLPGEVNAALATSDSTFILGGELQRDNALPAGWLASFDLSGRLLCRSEHPVPVAALAGMDEYVAAHGAESNLSIYSSELRPLWDHASHVTIVQLLACDFDGVGSTDLAVVAVAEQKASVSLVDSMRVLLRDEHILAGGERATEGDGGREREVYVKRDGSVSLFLSRRDELLSTVMTSRERAVGLLDEGDVEACLAAAADARGAAAALGDRESAAELTALMRRANSLPARSNATLLLALSLMVAGSLVAIGRWQRRLNGRLTGGFVAGLLGAGAAVWLPIGTTRWTPLLFAGAVLSAGLVLADALRRRRAEYGRVVAGSQIEELIEELAAFLHGGLRDSSGEAARDAGSSRLPDAAGGKRRDFARKNTTKLSYLAQEMIDSLKDEDRYERRLGSLRVTAEVFVRSVYPRAPRLARLGRETGFAVRQLARLAEAADEIRDALGVILGDERPGPEMAELHLRALKRGRKKLVAAAEEARAVFERNPGCSLHEPLGDALLALDDVLRDAGVTVSLSSTIPRERDAVRMKRHELFTIYENLISNAEKAMRGRGRKAISLRVDGSDDRCVVRVSDSGRGIAAQELTNIFVGSTDPSKGKFGLPYTRRTLRRYGGDITVVSTPGDVTTFTLELLRWRPEREAMGDVEI